MTAKKLIVKHVAKIERHTPSSVMDIKDIMEVWAKLEAFDKLMSLGFSADLLDENFFAVEAKCINAKSEPSTLFDDWALYTGEVEVTVTIFPDPVQFPF